MIRKNVEGSSCGQFEVQITPWVTACTQKQYFILLGGVTSVDKFIWSNDVQIDEAGKSTANHLVTWKGTSTTLLLQLTFSSLVWPLCLHLSCEVYYPSMSTGTEETMMNLLWYVASQLNFEPRPPKYKAEVLTMWPWHLMNISNH
jgi:hypothetical protein